MSSNDNDGSMGRKTKRPHRRYARVRSILFGRDLRLSVWVWFIAIMSTLGVAALVAISAIEYTPTGPSGNGSIALHSASYTQLVTLFISTYTGGPHHPLFIVAPGVLFIGAVVTTYLNEGLLPTAGLITGPIFGFFINRVGNPTVPGLVPEPLPLADGIIFALTGSLLYGVPIAVLGFIAGSGLRWVTRAVKSINRN